MAARTFRKKKQQQSRVFFGVIFIEHKGAEFRRKKNMEIQSDGERMRNARTQGAASKVKMSGSEK